MTETVWSPVGNVKTIAITPNPTTSKHKGTLGPTKRIDFVATTLIEMSFETQLDEWTLDNLQMAFLAERTSDTDGEYLKIGVAPVRRQLKFVGANAQGARIEAIFPSVFINAKAAIDFINDSDEISPLPLSGDILVDETLGAFGTLRFLDKLQDSAPYPVPDVRNYYLGTGELYTAPIA